MALSNTHIRLRAFLAVLLLLFSSPLLLLIALIYQICQISLRSMSTKSIKGEVALVTGAGHGLGRAIALELAKQGCHIAIADINLEGAEETVRQINEAFPVRSKAYKVNAASYSELSELKSNILKDLGPVTILINNAAILLLDNPMDPDPKDIQHMIDVNFSSHFWTKKLFLPQMKVLNKGHIVNISSCSSILPFPYNSAYCATKFGVTGHMRALRLELAVEKQQNIHVLTVLPWFLQTNNEVRELNDTINFSDFYPLIRGASAARRIVKGILNNEREIFLPDFVSLLYRLIHLFPLSWQEKVFLLFARTQIEMMVKVRP
ncbi:17-beta-hydroxysteroid dehydrogenase 13 [Drosophila mojavensis]|uniref:17-beta-hydroxysteroid dehydrogenase 13 n=1 Tax=Drosophila mojavensis TaxID=7230 RepID=UPI001CD0A9CD|nr:17-beta-hydroxysteroid dehydrogenase 13 [Drosophila mojavensis]